MSVLDALTIAITSILFALFFLTGTLITTNVGTAFTSINAITPSMATYKVFNSSLNSIYVADTLFVLLYMGLWIVAILAAAFIESETINLPLTIFLGVIIIIISFIISNAMHAVLGSPIYATVIQHFGNTQMILANLGAITALFIFLYAVVILARPLYQGGLPGGGTSSTLVVGP